MLPLFVILQRPETMYSSCKKKWKLESSCSHRFLPRKQRGGLKGYSWFPDDEPYIQLSVHQLHFTVQTSTWDPHGVNMHSCVLTWHSHTSWQEAVSCRPKCQPENNKLFGGSQSPIYQAGENMLPLNRPSENMTFPMKFHNPSLIYNPGGIRRHSIRFFFLSMQRLDTTENPHFWVTQYV